MATKTYANHYVDEDVYEEFKKNCDEIGMKYNRQNEILMKDFNVLMKTKDGRTKILKANEMYDRAKQVLEAAQAAAGQPCAKT